MFHSQAYELVDFGAGRKLERFASYLFDRPAPAATNACALPERWSEAVARFEKLPTKGSWDYRDPIDAPWTSSFGSITLELKPTDHGQLGVFPEQIDAWKWIHAQVTRAKRPLSILNLFAYTGGSTLAAALAGARVTHVDAASGVVAWARRNAALSGLDEAPIRWIVEDAPTFVRRELKRKNYYDAVILDPPAYGHGPDGETWKLEEHLGELVELCHELTRPARQFILLSCHSGELGTPDGLLKHVIAQVPKLREGAPKASEMALVSSVKKRLLCGARVTWTAHDVG